MKADRIIIFLLTLLLSLSLFSCTESTVKNREYDEQEVLLEARELIEKSISLNEILYGDGLSYDEESGIGIYKEATEESLSKYGIADMKDLTEKIEAVFSDSYIKTINSSDIFNPIVDEGVTLSYARYFEDEKETDDPQLKKSIILVNSKYEYTLKNKYEYIGELSVKGSEGEYVIVSSVVRATRADGAVRDFVIEIKLIEETYGWRLSTPTYVVYNEYTDIYEDMIK
ncbi:MAG: hypothetical protein IJX92_07045 [Clostridia bacterium]|nr:hypothetical protein [Clostridia bacterium]